MENAELQSKSFFRTLSSRSASLMAPSTQWNRMVEPGAHTVSRMLPNWPKIRGVAVWLTITMCDSSVTSWVRQKEAGPGASDTLSSNSWRETVWSAEGIGSTSDVETEDDWFLDSLKGLDHAEKFLTWTSNLPPENMNGRDCSCRWRGHSEYQSKWLVLEEAPSAESREASDRETEFSS